MRQSELAVVAATRARLASGDARAARLAAGVSAAEFARVIRVSRTAVGEWETGRKRPAAGHALAYGQLLARVAGLLAVIVVAVAGCSSAPPPVPSPATTVTAEATNPPLASTGPVSVTPVSPPAAPPPKQVSDPGQVTGSLAGMHCAYRGKQPDVLPDPACSPGAYDPLITAKVLCAKGYSTRSYRPPVYQTARFELEQAMPAYGLANIPGSASELDHLIPLTLGGANDASNLWPQLGPVPNPKDRVEVDLHRWVCGVQGAAAESRLKSARLAIAADWTTALETLGIGSRT